MRRLFTPVRTSLGGALRCARIFWRWRTPAGTVADLEAILEERFAGGGGTRHEISGVASVMFGGCWPRPPF